jgi:transposase
MMNYRIAGIDVHKRMLAVVAADIAGEGEFQFERHTFSTTPDQLKALAHLFIEKGIQEVVMESTAQYWKPVWEALERYWQAACREQPEANPMSGSLHLAQAESNRARRGRKNDFGDAERLIRRYVAQELVLSFVPSAEQRLWRTVTRRKQQCVGQRARLQNQMEAFLEEAHIKLSSLVSDLLGQSGRRMMEALAEGETDPAAIAAKADRNLRASQAQLCDALGAARELKTVYRHLLKQSLEELQLLEKQIGELDQELSSLLAQHKDAVKRLAEVPGLGADSAQQIIAEIGPTAATFPTAKDLASWVGVCPGDEISAGKSHSTKSPKGNRNMRRILNQAAHAAVKVKGSIFEVVFQRLRRGLSYKEAVWAIAHRLCRLTWILLTRGVRYDERGPSVSAASKRQHANRMMRALRRMGYQVDPPPEPQNA